MNYQNYQSKTDANSRSKYSLKKKHNPSILPYDQSRSIKIGYPCSQQNHNKMEGKLHLNKRSFIVQRSMRESSIIQLSRLNTETNDILKNQQTLSTAPSFQNPFLSHQTNNKKVNILPSQINKNIELDPYFLANYQRLQLQDDKHHDKIIRTNKLRQQKYLKQWKMNQNNKTTQPIVDQSFKTTNKKVSLKKGINSIHQVKSSIFVCMKYQHLQSTISMQKIIKSKTKDVQLGNMQGQSQIIQRFTNDFICNNNLALKQGCNCEPKCHWINKWMCQINARKIYNNRFFHQSSTIQNYYNQIEKDALRTYQQNKSFKNHQLLLSLKYVLVEYAKNDLQVGYVQGMNFVAATLVYHSRTNENALKILTHIMKQLNFRQIFLNDLSSVQIVSKAFSLQLCRLSYDLYCHLINQSINFELFIKSWYFSMFGSFIPLSSMHLVIQKFMNRQLAGLNQIILTFLLYLKDKLIQMHDSELQICFTNHMIMQFSKEIDWNDLITKSYHLSFQQIII